MRSHPIVFTSLLVFGSICHAFTISDLRDVRELGTRPIQTSANYVEHRAFVIVSTTTSPVTFQCRFGANHIVTIEQDNRVLAAIDTAMDFPYKFDRCPDLLQDLVDLLKLEEPLQLHVNEFGLEVVVGSEAIYRTEEARIEESNEKWEAYEVPAAGMHVVGAPDSVLRRYPRKR